jgi:hypothetical protein
MYLIVDGVFAWMHKYAYCFYNVGGLCQVDICRLCICRQHAASWIFGLLANALPNKPTKSP